MCTHVYISLHARVCVYAHMRMAHVNVFICMSVCIHLYVSVLLHDWVACVYLKCTVCGFQIFGSTGGVRGSWQ